MRHTQHYEADQTAFPAEHYRVHGYAGIAFYALGWETEPTDDTEWSGIEERTGRVLVVMVGDDRKHCVDVTDLTPLAEHEFCHSCGQIGCGCNVPEPE